VRCTAVGNRLARATSKISKTTKTIFEKSKVHVYKVYAHEEIGANTSRGECQLASA
jgi:hypothetical protein